MFPIFGPHWLAKAKPKEADEQIRLVSIGMIYITDVVVAETARLVAYTAGHYAVPEEKIVAECQQYDWKPIRSDIGVQFLENVMTDWDMVKTR